MKMNKAPRSVWTNPIHFLAFGFGAGASPIAPGTCGTLIAIPFYLLIQQLPLLLYLFVVIITAIVGIWLCDVAERDTGIPDNPGIVWDEIVGYFITMIAAPTGWMWVVLGFVLFRIFDVWKPWPIRWLDKNLKGGLGIMVDDWLAAGYAWISLQIIVMVVQRFA